MARMFCTLGEAAQRLHTTEEQIETMLGEGLLPEFREGSHRLVRAADVGVLATMKNSSPPPVGHDRRPERSLASDVRLPRCAAATVRAPDRWNAGPRNTQPGRQRRTLANETQQRRPSPSRAGARRERKPIPPEAQAQPQSLSVRQWFWTGLIQDRPLAIAILSGLVLLALASLVAGVCALAEAL